jgi:hypothetical protein
MPFTVCVAAPLPNTATADVPIRVAIKNIVHISINSFECLLCIIRQIRESEINTVLLNEKESFLATVTSSRFDSMNSRVPSCG